MNDSGQPLADHAMFEDDRVQVFNVGGRERSVARNVGAALARGQWLHFLDDDDWMLPGGLSALLEASMHSSADWIYGTTQLCDRNGRPLIRLQHKFRGNCFAQVMAGEWIPLQSSLIRADSFFAVGGFNQTIAGPEDIDLTRRILQRGLTAYTPEVVACVAMGDVGSTTDRRSHQEQSRLAREGILSMPDVWPRLVDSADSAYWRGRVARLYWTSVLWNLRRRRLAFALSRAGFGVRAVATAGLSLLRADYWRALSRPHQSQAFARGAQQAADAAGE